MFIKISVNIGAERQYFKVHNFDDTKLLSDILDAVWTRTEDQLKDTTWKAFLSTDGSLDDAPEIDLNYPLEAAKEIGCKHIIFAHPTTTEDLVGALVFEGTPPPATIVTVACDAQEMLAKVNGVTLLSALRQLRAVLTTKLGSELVMRVAVYSPRGGTQATKDAVTTMKTDALSSADPNLILRVSGAASFVEMACEAAHLSVYVALICTANTEKEAAAALAKDSERKIFSVNDTTPTPENVERLAWEDITTTPEVAEWVMPGLETPILEKPVQFGDNDNAVWRTQTADAGTFLDYKQPMQRSHTDTPTTAAPLRKEHLIGLPTKPTDPEAVQGGWVFEEEHSSSADINSAVDKADWVPLERTRTEAPTEDIAGPLPRSQTSPVHEGGSTKRSKGLGFLMSLPKKGSLGTQHPCYGKMIAWLRDLDGDGGAAALEANTLASDAVQRMVLPLVHDPGNPLGLRMDLRSSVAHAYHEYLCSNTQAMMCLIGEKGTPDMAPLLEKYSEEHEKMLEIVKDIPQNTHLTLPLSTSVAGSTEAFTQLKAVMNATLELRGAITDVGFDADLALIVNLADAREVVKALLEHHKGIGTLNLVAFGAVGACMYLPHLAGDLGSSLSELYKLRNLTNQVRRKRIMDVINTAFKAKCLGATPPTHHAVVQLMRSMLLNGPPEQVPRLRVDAANVLQTLLSVPGEQVLSALCLLESVGERLDEEPSSIIAQNAIFARLDEMEQADELPPRQLWDLRRVQILRENGWVVSEDANKALDASEGVQLRVTLFQMLQQMLLGEAALLTRALLFERYPQVLAEGRIDLQWTSFAQTRRMMRDLSQLAYEMEPVADSATDAPQQYLMRYLEGVAGVMPPQMLALHPIHNNMFDPMLSDPLLLNLPLGNANGNGHAGHNHIRKPQMRHKGKR